MGVLVRALLVFVVPLHEKEAERSSSMTGEDRDTSVAPLTAAGVINDGTRASPVRAAPEVPVGA